MMFHHVVEIPRGAFVDGSAVGTNSACLPETRLDVSYRPPPPRGLSGGEPTLNGREASSTSRRGARIGSNNIAVGGWA